MRPKTYSNEGVLRSMLFLFEVSPYSDLSESWGFDTFLTTQLGPSDTLDVLGHHVCRQDVIELLNLLVPVGTRRLLNCLVR